MGTPKGLVILHEKTWLETQIEKFSKFGSSLIIVLGHHSDHYQQRLPWLKFPEKNPWNLSLRVALNPNPEQGSFSSLLCGLNALSAPCAFILPIDTPVAHSSVWTTLIHTARQENQEIYDAVIPTHLQKGGHPVYLGCKMIERLRALPPDSPESRLDFQIKSPETHSIQVEVHDPNICLNLNTPEEFQRFSLNYSKNKGP